jgi:hypothetical protein
MITPVATTYVLWLREQGGEPTNQGQYKVENNLKGKFKTTARFQNFEVIDSGRNGPDDQNSFRPGRFEAKRTGTRLGPATPKRSDGRLSIYAYVCMTRDTAFGS